MNKEYSIDLSLLDEFIKRSGLTKTYIAKELNITYVGFNNKTQGRSQFSLSEALKLKRLLNMTQQEWEAVFDETV